MFNINLYRITKCTDFLRPFFFYFHHCLCQLEPVFPGHSGSETGDLLLSVIICQPTGKFKVKTTEKMCNKSINRVRVKDIEKKSV